eukprot:6454785-Amphidinium_carterae.1
MRNKVDTTLPVAPDEDGDPDKDDGSQSISCVRQRRIQDLRMLMLRTLWMRSRRHYMRTQMACGATRLTWMLRTSRSALAKPCHRLYCSPG